MFRSSGFSRFALSACLVASATSVLAVEIEKFNDDPLANAGYPFSESVRVGDLLFLSGQIGILPDGSLAPGGIRGEAHQTLLNISEALDRRGLGMEHVVKCTVFLADVSEWAAFNEVYQQHFSSPYPARSALGANGLALGARTEVECIAAYGSLVPETGQGCPTTCPPGEAVAETVEEGITAEPIPETPVIAPSAIELTIAGVEPSAVVFGTREVAITVLGTGFNSGSIVIFEGVSYPASVNQAGTRLVATLPTRYLSIGPYAVTVSNGPGTKTTLRKAVEIF